ncbi:kinesin-like protein klpa [Lasallia pustulata]|uniref:Kinesin-like protein n=1 Tax=Lasallia pustulata TaxID=136370 RepID=A0A1W5D3B0_9LECA|nr:kinesin-like protein klpa [Lasallia pustulata]
MDFNENSFISQLRQPSRIPSPGKLLEVSASANNVRSSSMLPPPPGTATLKRKTLAERAGEPPRPAPAPPSSRPVSAAVKATAIAGVSRNASFSSSVSSRAPSVSSRNVSNSSFASSVGPSTRPPSAQSTRPQTSMAHGRSSVQAPKPTPARPASSLDVQPSGGTGDRKAWDTRGRLEDMESLYSELRNKLNDTTHESSGLKDTVAIYKTRLNELESTRAQLSSSNATISADLKSTKASLSRTTIDLEDARRDHSIELDDVKRQHRRDLDGAHREAEEEAHKLSRKHHEELIELKRRLENALGDEKLRRIKEVQALTTEAALAEQRKEVELDVKEKELEGLKADLHQSKANLVCEQDLNRDLRIKLSEAASNAMSLESSMRALRSRIDFLESDSRSQSQAFAEVEQKLQEAFTTASEAKEKLRVEETLRRKLHNQVQELKGNIRVFCRVRPPLESDPVNETARITFPDADSDSKEVEVMGPEEKSSLGNITTKSNAFTFDRVFAPSSQNADVFEEISQLVQSALDGYNVCIFCYGQTGSGKTYTMSADDGMIPRAVHQIYDTAQALEEKGWKYSMEGSFVEVYNENLNDLLGKPEEFDKKKHEIRHDMQKCKTTITDITTEDLDSPSKVESILRRATANRSVAATKANERSSRSHSVFILRLIGENSITGERSEGTLNLVDLAGSERLSQSGSTGDRLKETQNINKSLSCLGDVIGALGQGKEGGHVPYRNSKLTYLLQFSLGGNSKTLMFVNISPIYASLNETLTSLRFATKVHNTHIGTAKRQAKIRDP